MGPGYGTLFDSGAVYSFGPYLVYGIAVACLGFLKLAEVFVCWQPVIPTMGPGADPFAGVPVPEGPRE